MQTMPPKDPSAKLDYLFDWSQWLETGETITDSTITVSDGITLEDSTESGGLVTVWLSGGTPGDWYTCACRITTSDNRIDERTMQIKVENR